MVPFYKLPPTEKDRIFLECFVPLITNEAITGKKFIGIEEVHNNLTKITDIIKDDLYIDINRVQQHFAQNTWSLILSLISAKKKQLLVCLVCDSCIDNDGMSVLCIRCLSRIHMLCVFGKNMSKKRKTPFVPHVSEIHVNCE